jgi:hypothetical protein
MKKRTNWWMPARQKKLSKGELDDVLRRLRSNDASLTKLTLSCACEHIALPSIDGCSRDRAGQGGRVTS